MIEYYYSINGSWKLNRPVKDYFSDRWDTITLTRRELTLMRQILRHTNNYTYMTKCGIWNVLTVTVTNV